MDVKDTGTNDSYHALLIEYASGCMDEAHALVIATHMALSPPARKIVADYEAVGGSLLNTHCKPVAMKEDARKCVMDKLEKLIPPCAPAPCSKQGKNFSRDFLATPVCLEKYIESTTWMTGDGGQKIIHVKTSCSGSKAHLVKITAQETVTPDTTRTGEIAVILQGALIHHAQSYKRGDLLILEKSVATTLLADSNDDCVIFTVRPSPSIFKSWMKKLFKC